MTPKPATQRAKQCQRAWPSYVLATCRFRVIVWQFSGTAGEGAHSIAANISGLGNPTRRSAFVKGCQTSASHRHRTAQALPRGRHLTTRNNLGPSRPGGPFSPPDRPESATSGNRNSLAGASAFGALSGQSHSASSTAACDPKQKLMRLDAYLNRCRY
jgi:hypothetical protein